MSEDDKAAFLEAVQGIKKLSYSKIVTKSDIPIPSKKLLAPEKDALLPFSDYDKLDNVTYDERIEYRSADLPHKILRNLSQGQYTIEAILDLHGKKVDDARDSLTQFLLQCQQNGIRHVLIIHGKGRSTLPPVLKNRLNHWLRQIEWVLGFSSAKPAHGGVGALYILLKRLRNK